MRAAGVVVVLMGYVTFAITETTLNPSFRLIEVERVADAIYGRGVSYGYLYRHLRGPEAVRLLGTLAALEPLGPPPRVTDQRDLLVLRVERGDLPPDVPAPKCRWWLPPLAEVSEGDAALALLIRAAEGA